MFLGTLSDWNRRSIRTRLAVFFSILFVVQFMNVVYSQPISVPGVVVLIVCWLRCLCHDLSSSRCCTNGFVFEKMFRLERLYEA